MPSVGRGTGTPKDRDGEGAADFRSQEVVYFATGLKKARGEGKKCHAKTMKNKKSW